MVLIQPADLEDPALAVPPTHQYSGGGRCAISAPTVEEPAAPSLMASMAVLFTQCNVFNRSAAQIGGLP